MFLCRAADCTIRNKMWSLPRARSPSNPKPPYRQHRKNTQVANENQAAHFDTSASKVSRAVESESVERETETVIPSRQSRVFPTQGQLRTGHEKTHAGRRCHCSPRRGAQQHGVLCQRRRDYRDSCSNWQQRKGRHESLLLGSRWRDWIAKMEPDFRDHREQTGWPYSPYRGRASPCVSTSLWLMIIVVVVWTQCSQKIRTVLPSRGRLSRMRIRHSHTVSQCCVRCIRCSVPLLLALPALGYILVIHQNERDIQNK
mmetsp:Transcript_52878/g.132919  ORF Transcript_52878/g.132919 Transcript_52878/m.132919 type:complete len:257 (+) Transcript_52878:740-1510(+)